MGNLFSIESPLWNMTNKILHFLWLSILWFVCSLPIITIGASTTALYSVSLKYVRKEEGYLTSSFFQAFRENFKQSSVICLLFMVIGSALFLDFVVYFRSQETSLVSFILTTLFFSLCLVFILVNIYVYAILSKFDNTVTRTILNAFIMAVKHWPSSMMMLLLAFAVIVVGMLLFPPILLCAPALITYVNSKMLGKIFLQYAGHNL